MNEIYREIVDDAMRELAYAEAKYPAWPTDPLHAIAVLGEEFGELTKATLQLTYQPEKVSRSELWSEAVQVVAMAMRFLASFDQYEYEPSPPSHTGGEGQ